MHRRQSTSERGQSLTEVARLLVLLLLVIIGVLRVLEVSLAQVYCKVTQLGLITFGTPISDGY